MYIHVQYVYIMLTLNAHDNGIGVLHVLSTNAHNFFSCGGCHTSSHSLEWRDTYWDGIRKAGQFLGKMQ